MSMRWRRENLRGTLLSGLAVGIPGGYFLLFNHVLQRPYFLQRGDPEQDLFYIARVMATGRPPSWYGHPGTPVHYFLYNLYRFVGGEPARFFYWAHFAVAMTLALAALFLVRRLLRQVPLGVGWFALALALAQPTVLVFTEQLCVDSFLLPVVLVFVVLIWGLLSEEARLRQSVWAGLWGGLMLSIKMAALPIALAASVALTWRWGVASRWRWRSWLGYHAALVASFAFLAPFPQWDRLIPIVLSLTTRADVKASLSLIPLVKRWIAIIKPYDVYWLGVVWSWEGVVLGIGWVIFYWLRKERQWLFTSAGAQAVFLAVLVAGWGYTLLAQQRTGFWFTDQVLFNFGYLTRNIAPPTLAFPLAVIWLKEHGPWPGRLRWWNRALWGWGFFIWGMAVGGFTIEHAQVLTLLKRLSHMTQQRLQAHVTPGTRLAFFAGKGITLFGEASFHFEGNYARGQGLFTHELLARYPQYTFFELRDAALARAQWPLIEYRGKAAHRVPPPNCASIAGRREELLTHLPREYLWGFSEGIRPSIVAFTWVEMEGVSRLTLSEALQILCTYGTPTQVETTWIGPIRWVIVEMTYPPPVP